MIKFNITLDSPSSSKPNLEPALIAVLKDVIASNGPISFSSYMQYALYHEQFGYYMQKAPIFGASGDFVTAPTMSRAFATTLAYDLQQVLKANPNWQIMELGAGNGALANAVLASLAHYNLAPDYWLIDKNLSRIKIDAAFSHHTHISSNIPDDFTGIIIANEFFDAWPIDLFRVEQHKVHSIAVNYQQGLTFSDLEPTPLMLALHEKYNFPEHYLSEVAPNYREFWQNLNKKWQAGLMYIFDYGYPEREYYHHARNLGTLTCYYQQQKNYNPLTNPGLQDLTAHVNFTELAYSAWQENLQVLGYTTQGYYLASCGIHHKPQDASLHILTSPNEMGELVKVLLLGKNTTYQGNGFSCDLMAKL